LGSAERVRGIAHFGGFFHQIKVSQWEERSPFKPSSQESGDRIGFSLKRLKTLNFTNFKHMAVDDLNKTFEMVLLLG
jgi:hypothetical protein